MLPFFDCFIGNESDRADYSVCRTFTSAVYGLDIPNLNSSSAYLSTATQVLVSSDDGRTWIAIASEDLPQDKTLNRVTVSPANNACMALWYKGALHLYVLPAESPQLTYFAGDDYQWQYLHSEDGGIHWANSRWNNTLSFMPYNVRQAVYAYHPIDESIVRCRSSIVGMTHAFFPLATVYIHCLACGCTLPCVWMYTVFHLPPSHRIPMY
jgi:hypothetical protein